MQVESSRTRRGAPGVRARHARACASQEEGRRCNCKRTWEASVGRGKARRSSFSDRGSSSRAQGEVVSLPDAMEPLIDYYRRFPGENPDWEDYRARMERERRVPVRIVAQRAGPDRQG